MSDGAAGSATEGVAAGGATGERVAVLAPSGYGKTTLAMLLAGYLKPVQGEILLDGRLLPGKGVCPVQLICQHPEHALNPRWRLKRVLEESGGLREDVLEDYLVCDEISTMLDVITQAQIWNAILQEAGKRNMGIITVTHNRHLAGRIAERMIDLSV